MHVVVHGGAGRAPDHPADRQGALADAAEAGTEAETPLDAACAAVRVLERDPHFNAGVGGAVQHDGVVRTDAGLMTDDGAAGAAAAMPGVEHAVDVARVVAAETPHVLVAGEGALALAADYGVAREGDLLTDETRERWAAADPPDGGPEAVLPWVRERYDAPGGRTDDDPPSTPPGDTVGAATTDGEALAAATSTGGRWFALAGRVGDVPQVGAGFYADERGAVSATGAGEAIARFGLARRTVDLLDGWNPNQAAREAIEEFDDATGADAGVVVIDPAGHVGTATNAASMQTARE